jgi:hypothetical protein
MGLSRRLIAAAFAATTLAAMLAAVPAYAGHRLLDDDARVVVPDAESTSLAFRIAAHGYFAPTHVAALSITSDADRVAITAFAGEFRTGGYSVSVQGVLEQRFGSRSQVCVLAALARPARSAKTIEAVTQPYETVLLERTALGAAVPRSWILYDVVRGAVLAASSHASIAACEAAV